MKWPAITIPRPTPTVAIARMLCFITIAMAVCLNDADGDGVCDEIEIGGCTDPMALNYSAEATDDDGSCMYCTLRASVAVSDVSLCGCR